MSSLWLVGTVAAASVAAAAVVPAYRRWPLGTTIVVAALSVALFASFAAQAAAVARGELVALRVPWVPALGIELSLQLDGLSLVFALLVTGIGAFVLAYAPAYLDWKPRSGRLLALLLAFMAAMLGLVLADDAITMFVFWELTSITSFFLIAFDATAEARVRARQALIVTTAGGLALLVGLVLAAHATGGGASASLVGLADAGLADDALYPAILVLVALGAFTKSAQVPFHFWLPGAMVAPSPVSAYLHSATMVNAGVYLLARLSPALGGTALWTALIGSIGALTFVVGGALAILQRDLKATLAYSTIAALGAMTLLLGIGGDAAVIAALTLLLAHAAYKAALFLAAGNVLHVRATRDPYATPGCGRQMPLTAAAAALAAASMAGVPVVFGFVAKDALFAAVLGGPGGWVLVALAVIGASCLVAAAWIAGVAPFFRGRQTGATRCDAPAVMVAGPLALACLGFVLGLAPVIAEPMVAAAARAVTGRSVEVELALWHGLSGVHGLALGLGLTSLTLGSLGYRALVRRVDAIDRARARIGSFAGEPIFERVLGGIAAVAHATTRTVQHGHLPGYVAVCVGTMLVVVGLPLALAPTGRWEASMALTPYELPLVGIAIGGAFATAAFRDRLASVAALGATGLAITFLYALFSAPDLAITQLTVETMMVILLVLAFRRLPRVITRPRAPTRALHFLIAGASGAVITSLLLLATAPTPFVADAARAHVELATSHNVVNAVLVNFRAIDTLGEVCVIAIAGIGVLALLGGRLGRGATDASSALLRLSSTRVILVGLLAMLSVYALLRGHDAPGGGFAGGLLLAATLAVPLLSHGPTEARRTLRVDPRSLVGAGLATTITVALIGFVTGGSLLAPWSGPELPTLGHVGTVLLFDIGVYLIVAGTALSIMLAVAEDS
jgi:multicomponent Na+:H+ antiporter subunit A